MAVWRGGKEEMAVWRVVGREGISKSDGKTIGWEIGESRQYWDTLDNLKESA